MLTRFLYIVLILLGVPSALNAAETPPVNFSHEILPILSDNCFHCHGPDKNARKSDLRIDTREGAIAVKDGVAAIVPGNSAKSEMIKRIYSGDSEEFMPPPKAHKILSAEQKALIKRWIDEGARWGKHWAYDELQRPPVPSAGLDARLIRNPVDAFIQTRLLAKKISPSAEAPANAVLRRASLDLIGIPPTLDEQNAFLADRSAEAYEKMIDRLLASPHYGERMAQQWLDVVRYADTVGFHGDQNQNAWPFRDYVIDAFNSNKRFDQFTLEQIAGDLLPNPTPEQRIATCFNRLNMMTREGGAQPKEYLAKYNGDRVRTVSMAWLGSTLGCAECHDHKFDPYSTKDFYSMGAYFADVRQWGVYMDYGYTPNPDLKGYSNDFPFPPEIIVDNAALKRRVARIEKDIQKMAASTKPAPEAFETWQKSMLAFVTKNPTGWETPDVSALIEGAAPQSKKADAKEEASKPAADYEITPDGRVIFNKKTASTVDFDLRPAASSIASIRIELLPDARHNNKIVATGESAALAPAFTIEKKGKKGQTLSIRYAQANYYLPRYANGFEIMGVQASWKTDPKHSGKAHSAVYFLETPAQIADGDTLRVRLKGVALASIRISLSPLAPDIFSTEFPANLSQSVEQEAFARVHHLRSTAWNPELFKQLKPLDNEQLSYRSGKTPVMVTESISKPLTMRVLPRGNWQDESGEICKPETPHFLPKLKLPDGQTQTRADLAKWLCSPENPLTARVIMNRLWKQMFGNGLSAQVDDLGAQGEPPTHPELLDWLAVEFRESGWDYKRMVKLLALSHTYRQSSSLRPELRDADPLNRMLASQNPRRLEAEIVRDNALAIAGLLNTEMGGPPSKPYQPDRYYEGLQFPDRKYVAEKDERQYRRGVYMHWQRTFLQPMLANFDAPSREDCVAMRTNANSPQQALTLLNDPSFIEAARTWAARLMTSAKSDDERLDQAFRQALARAIKQNEKSSLAAFLTQMRQEYKAKPEDAAKLKKVGLKESPADLDDVELAAWTSVCRVLLNLHETITR